MATNGVVHAVNSIIKPLRESRSWCDFQFDGPGPGPSGFSGSEPHSTTLTTCMWRVIMSDLSDWVQFVSLQLRRWTGTGNRLMDLQLFSDRLHPLWWVMSNETGSAELRSPDPDQTHIPTLMLIQYSSFCLTGRRQEIQERSACLILKGFLYFLWLHVFWCAFSVFTDDLFQKVVRSRSSRTMNKSQ